MKKRTMLCFILCIFIAQLTWSRSVKPEPTPPGPKKKVILLEPTADRPSKTLRPTFKWQLISVNQLKGVTFSLIVKELPEKGDPGSGPLIFERKGIREMYFQYPAELPELNSKKIYIWKVTAFDMNNKLIDVSDSDIITPADICMIFSSPTTQSICGGTIPSLNANIWFTGTGIINWTLSCPNCSPPVSNQGVMYNSGPWPAPPLLPLVTPGVYTYTLSASKGSCHKSATFKVNVYPQLTAVVADQEICSGMGGTKLKLTGIPSLLDNAVTWTWEDSLTGTFPSPPSFPLGAGNNWKNTGIISTSSCASSPYVIRRYTGTVNLSSLNLPTQTPPGCPNYAAVNLKVWCPPIVGNIMTPASSTHNFSNSQHTKICSGNNIPPNGPYPVKINLELTGSMGAINWTSNPPVMIDSPHSPNVICTISSPGTYTFTATVTNGTCKPATKEISITVADPINVIVKAQYDMPFCPHDDAVVFLYPTPPLLPPGAIITWSYQINSIGNWIDAGIGTGAIQYNTNNIGPISENWNSVCWRATIEDPNGICPDFITNSCCIDVTKPPCTPVISAPSKKCVGHSAEIVVTPPNPSDCGVCIGYQWYLDGNQISPPGSHPPYYVTEPGNYVVEALSVCPGLTTASNLIKIKDCLIKIVIVSEPYGKPICCSDGHTPITVKAVVNSNCGGPYTYHWTGGGLTGNNALFTIPAPQTTTVYTVTVNDGYGCQASASITITACNYGD